MLSGPFGPDRGVGAQSESVVVTRVTVRACNGRGRKDRDEERLRGRRWLRLALRCALAGLNLCGLAGQWGPVMRCSRVCGCARVQ